MSLRPPHALAAIGLALLLAGMRSAHAGPGGEDGAIPQAPDADPVQATQALWTTTMQALHTGRQAADDDDPAAVAEALGRATAACSEAFRDRARLSCTALLRNLMRSGGPVHAAPAEPTGDGGAQLPLVLVDGLGEAHPAWLLARSTPEGWRFVDGGDAHTTGQAPGPALPSWVGADAGTRQVLAPVFDAVSEGPPQAVDPLLTPGFAATADAEQARRAAGEPSVRLHPYFVRCRASRCLVDALLLRRGTPRDRLSLLLQRDPDGGPARVDGVTESAALARAWREGTLPPRLPDDALVPAPALEPVFEAVAALARGDELPDGAPLSLDTESPFRHASAPTALRLERAWHLDGTVLYGLCTRDAAAPEDSPLRLFLRREGAGWVVAWWGYGLDCDPTLVDLARTL